jgi:mannose-1-phosphate guanylyltransferase
MFHAVIMAGGGGTRFWPRSRAARPKQFLSLVGERTLLQQALDRVEAQVPRERTWVITAGPHWARVHEQLPDVPREQIIGEPCGRDTAACAGLGAALVAHRDPEAIMLITPADHVIEPEAEFRRAIHVAVQMVEEHPAALVTVGIPPAYPATGYGYIHRGPELTRRQGLPVYRVRQFKEKPKREVAEEYVASGQYFWNSGIFVWKAQTILNALKEHAPPLFAALQKITAAWPTRDRDTVFQREYEGLTRVSIDLAVMEKAKEVLVVQAPFRWDDVGTWRALERMQPQDADRNTVLARHLGLDTRDCLIVADENVLVTTIGVEHLLIVQDGDAILVADKRNEDAVKQLVERLREKRLEQYL